MYKLSVPIAIETINENSICKYVEQFKNSGVDRVFVTSISSVLRKKDIIYTNPDKLKETIRYFKNKNFEVGVWISAFGHGSMLANDKGGAYLAPLTKIRGADGKEFEEGYCPLDENLRNIFYNAVKKIADMGVDIIMFDDDFRLNIRSYEMGCCCDKHMEIFCQMIGENVPLDKMEELVFTGGPNKYRDAWLEMSRKTLLDFAYLMRKAVDEVDENIRLGCCAVYTTWDFEGADMIEISKAFAGKTKPYIRTIGAPYHSLKVQYAVEHVRMQSHWCEGENIEIFSEGDVYPRPRYAVPAALLEAFDNALVASGSTGGILKYMFDYNNNADYEKGYNIRHIRNIPLRENLRRIFKDKKHIGVRVYEAMHKVRNFELPEEYVPGVSKFVWNTYFSIAQKLLSENAIPSVYGKSEKYPVMVFGENARYVELSELKNGVITDVVGAKILLERGIDTGLISSEDSSSFGEYFVDEDDTINSITHISKKKVVVSEKAKAGSLFTPDNTPASYTYENADGLRVLVFCIDAYRSDKNNCNYFDSYYRQKQLTSDIEWLCGEKLPVKTIGNPYVYAQSARGEDGSLSVAVFNMNIDEVIDAEIVLDKEYSEVEFIGCTGELSGDKIKLTSDIAAYGTAAFEVR